MNKYEYMKVTNNLNRLLNSGLISNNEYLQACALLDRKFAKIQKAEELGA